MHHREKKHHRRTSELGFFREQISREEKLLEQKKRRGPEPDLREDAPEGEDVDGGAVALAAVEEQLRRHVGLRAAERGRAAAVAAGRRHAEVAELDPVAAVEEDVRGLDVAV